MSCESSSSTTPVVEIIYYTDPLCAWSWAMESHWRLLRFVYGNQITCRYCMVGLIPRWDRFHDPLHSISRPAQMGPLWLQISQDTGAPLDSGLWEQDPPASSMPACLAVKAAQQQGEWCAEAYLRRLREAAMLLRRNIARRETLRDVAAMAAEDLPPELPFDLELWRASMNDLKTGEDLLGDLRLVLHHGIERIPTMQFKFRGNRSLLCVGHRDFFALSAALRHLNPEIQPQRQVTLREFTAYWGRLTRQELAVALGIQLAECDELLHHAAQAGELDHLEILA